MFDSAFAEVAALLLAAALIGALALRLRQPMIIAFILVGILISLAVVPVALIRIPAPSKVIPVKISLRELTGLAPLVIVAFVLLAVFQNFWRPILIGRVASHADSTQTATVLSIESQANSLFVAVVAPLLGWSIDLLASSGRELSFLPVAALGLTVSTLMLVTGRQRNS